MRKFINAKLIDEHGALEWGELWESGGKIVKIIRKDGNEACLRAKDKKTLLEKSAEKIELEDNLKNSEIKNAEIYNVGGNLIIPSFCNTHAHAAMSLFRGAADDLPLQIWLDEKIFPLEQNLNDEDIYYGTLLALAEFARGGITCFSNMYLNKDEPCLEAAINSGFNISLCGAFSDNTGTAKENINLARDKYEKFNGKSEKYNYMLALHAEYTCSKKLIEGICELACSLQVPTYIHLSETLQEVGDCNAKNGLTPPQYLDKFGFFDNGGIAAHCTFLDKEDIELLKKRSVCPSINSGSNLKLGSGIAGVYSMLKAGLKITLGTDGAASNNSLSMFKEGYLVSALQKVALHDASVISAQEVLDFATKNGFQALGFEKRGEIKEGNYADFTIIDLNSPNMRPLTNVRKNLVYSADLSSIYATVCGGKLLYDRGNYYLCEDLDKIYNECEIRAKRLIDSI